MNEDVSAQIRMSCTVVVMSMTVVAIVQLSITAGFLMDASVGKIASARGLATRMVFTDAESMPFISGANVYMMLKEYREYLVIDSSWRITMLDGTYIYHAEVDELRAFYASTNFNIRILSNRGESIMDVEIMEVE